MTMITMKQLFYTEFTSSDLGSIFLIPTLEMYDLPSYL